VAEGTPEALKAQVGSPHLDIALEPGIDPAAARDVLARFGALRPAPEGSVSVAVQGGAADIAPVVRALDEAGITVGLHRPRAAHARRRVRGEDRPPAGGRRRVRRAARRGGRRVIRPTIALARRRCATPCAAPVPRAARPLPHALPGRERRRPDPDDRAAGLPEVDGFLDFQLAAAMTQSLLLGGVATGIATALEIEGGFFDRLVSSPVPRLALVLGRLVAAAIISAAQIVYFLVVGLVFGASIAGGIPGALVVLLIGVVAGVGFGAIGQAIALRARSASTVQGIFPLVFVILFVSSAFFPMDLLESPLDAVARYNPLSYVATACGGRSSRASRRPRARGPGRRRGHRRRGHGDLRPRPAREARRGVSLGMRANLAVVRALVRRALNEISRVPGAAIPGVLAPTIFMLGITSVFGQADRLPGFDADFRAFVVPLGLPAGGRVHRRGHGGQPRPRHRGRLVRPAAALPRAAGRDPGRRRRLRRPAVPAALVVPVRGGPRDRRGLPGGERHRHRVRARHGPGLRDGVLERHHRAALPHAAGGAAHAGRVVHRGAVHHVLRAEGAARGLARGRRDHQSRDPRPRGRPPGLRRRRDVGGHVAGVPGDRRAPRRARRARRRSMRRYGI
jgi:hypothetical protein